MADVLVVEDEESLLQTLRCNLSRAGHDVRLCTDGRVALEMLLGNPPDLVLLDLMLPNMDGLEVGADDYLTKPLQHARAARTRKGAAPPRRYGRACHRIAAGVQ